MVGGNDSFDAEMQFSPNSGHSSDMTKIPKNRHGDHEFIVKVQNSFDPRQTMFKGHVGGAHEDDSSMFSSDISIYDEPKSFWIHVGKSKCSLEHAALVRSLKVSGHPGAMNPMGRKVYLYARRVAGVLRVTVSGRIPSQQQRW